MNKIIYFSYCLAILPSLHACNDGGGDAGTCGSNQIHDGEKCVCTAGFGDCNGAAIDGCEAYLAGDPANCGACGTVCAPGWNCTAGICQPSCGEGLTQCGGLCVDTMTDSAHCGNCATRCDADKVCSVGTCVCAEGMTDCGTGCVDLMTDPAYCGNCATRCDADKVCSVGTCACAEGMTDCGTGCVDMTTDPAYCGNCATSCGPGEYCEGGACHPRVCTPGEPVCSGSVATVCNAIGSGPEPGGTDCSDSGKICEDGHCLDDWTPLVFSVMGDVPRSSGEEETLQQQIADHNLYSPAEFMVHVGDIKSGSTACSEDVYATVAGYLQLLRFTPRGAPRFKKNGIVITGDRCA